MFTRSRPPAPEPDDGDDDVGIDAIDLTQLAYDQRSTGVVFDDDRMIEDGRLVSLDGPTLLEEQAALVGEAAGLAQEAAAVDATADPRAEAARLDGELIERLRSVIPFDRRRLAHSATLLEALQQVPNAVRAPHAEALSLGGKAAMALGDTAFLASTFYDQGKPLWLALFSGLALSASAVFAGSMAGTYARVHYDRVQRGPVPAEVALSGPESPLHAVVDLYDVDGRSRRPLLAWTVTAVVAAAVIGSAIGLFARGGGSPELQALGLALAGGMTVLGSAAATAYGTNQAADRIDEASAAVETHRQRLDGVAVEVGAREAAASWAASTANAGRLRAAASRLGHRAVIDTRHANPRVFDYVSRRSEEELALPVLRLPDPTVLDPTPGARPDPVDALDGADALDAYLASPLRGQRAATETAGGGDQATSSGDGAPANDSVLPADGQSGQTGRQGSPGSNGVHHG